MHYLKFGKNENRTYKITTEEFKKIDLFYYGLLIEENNEVSTFDNSPLNNNFHNKIYLNWSCYILNNWVYMFL